MRRMSGLLGREVAVVSALFLLAILIRLPTLDQPLLERFGFRQTQTAYTALLYHEDGVDLLHPKLPVFGEPFEVPFEFPLFQALAAAVMSWGLSPDVAVRAVALACFLLSSVLLWALVRHVAGRLAALVALAFFMFSPFSILYSRASLIEYLAVAGSLGWIWCGLLWREHRHPALAVAALASGLVVMLVKPTTGVFWVLPLLAHTISGEERGWRQWVRTRLDPVLVCVIALPVIAALAWTHHADSIKAAAPATEWLTTSRLQEWNFGTVDQRLVLSNWTTVMGRIEQSLTFAPAWLLPLAGLLGIGTRWARFWVALVAIPLLTILVFWNLYVFHDYYLAAITPVPAAAIGFSFSRLWRVAKRRTTQRLVAAVGGTWLTGLLAVGSPYSRIAYRSIDPREELPALQELTQFTDRSDLVAFEEIDWSSRLPYYSRRAGFIIQGNPSPGERQAASQLGNAGYRFLVTSDLRSELAVNLIRGRRWTGVLGRWVYVTGDDRGDVQGAPVAATESPGLDLLDGAAPLLERPMVVPCGANGIRLPRGTGTTIIRLAPDTPPAARLSVASGYGSLPARPYVVVLPGANPGPLSLKCTGVHQVRVTDVLDQAERSAS